MSDRRLFHIALASDWQAARSSGFYDRSTLGASVDDIGFIHCSRGMSQVDATLAAHYSQVNAPLVLLHIDEDALMAAGLRVIDEPVDPQDPGSEAFPHVFGGALPLEVVAYVLPRPEV